ncbi:hypothetical protein BOX15_Mlig008540g3 [Macrostomum lignano]|uniref:DAGKc domain-containing protein n=1 Tax=Macrostomum lignano TaxID=282301 RepID=A0A267H8P5_9PLAT|nr:hypothetical protein BOX15_Mlig008540g3 [Macrostomum lignano]
MAAADEEDEVSKMVAPSAAAAVPKPIRGHLIGRQGTWQLHIDAAALRFVRQPPAASKESAKDDNESFVCSFDDTVGVGFISDGGCRSRYLCAFRYVRRPVAAPGRPSGPRQRSLVLFRIVQPADPPGVALVGRLCSQAVARSMGREPGPPGKRPLLVLLNPRSGQGRADKLFRETAEPLLEEAGLAHRLVRTESAGHATRLLRDSPAEELLSYSGLVIVSGDGLLYEALNGLAGRPDCLQLLRRLPFGVLPAGGGNAVAASLAHANGDCLDREFAVTAAFNLAKARPRPVDLALVEAASGASYLACLSVNYGLLAQVDLESERYRFLGGARFALAFGIRLAAPGGLRVYRARLSYLPAEVAEAKDAETADVSNDNGDDNNRKPLASLKRHLPASLSDPLPSNAGWVTEEADYLLVLASLHSHLATDNFYAPPCRPDDGRIYVTWVAAGVSKVDLLRMFLSVGDGGHFRAPAFRCAAARAFRLEPLDDGGPVCIDGETAPCEAMQVELLPRLGLALTPARIGITN